jgi:hypothetical protein
MSRQNFPPEAIIFDGLATTNLNGLNPGGRLVVSCELQDVKLFVGVRLQPIRIMMAW